MMRARHYDATHGRFMSFDPLGFAGISPNLYVYANNNPLTVKDPTGEFAVILGAAVLRAGYSAAIYLVTTPPSEYTVGGIAGSAVSGVVTIPVIGDALGSITEDLVDKGSVDWYDVGEDATVGAAIGSLGKKTGKLEGKVGKKAKGAMPKSRTGPLRRYYEHVKRKSNEYVKSFKSKISEDFYPDAVSTMAKGKIRMNVENIVNDTFGEDIEKAKEKVTEIIDQTFIRSQDPNDIIGPSGYGDARFIPANLVLEYKIRFENDPNATAPAQRVFISHRLDDDVDVRTFRVGSFGFGEFTQNVTLQRAFIQDVINMTESLGILVRVRAGIDVISSEAFWDMQSIDPETGEAPIDPTVGFLPPNNGTTGQGFVTFTVRAKQQLGPLPTIDAVASITFDQNEPIVTPPIFNTIDDIAPAVNVTAIQDLLSVGTPAVSLSKSDVGSGVATVDLYLLEDDQLRPLLLGRAEQTAILPLLQGFQYQVVARAIDNVGNMQTLEDALQNVLPLNFTTIPITCPNDCSGQGNCSSIGTCQCQTGFYGSDCSQVTPPLEPPFLNFTSPSTTGQEDNPVTVYVFATPVRDTTGADELVISISGLPAAAILSNGMRLGEGLWKLIPEDFGNLEILLPTHFSGLLEIQATAYFENHQNTTSRSRGILFTIEPVPDAPYLVVVDTCYNASRSTVDIFVESRLVDMNGLEELSLVVHGLPENVSLVEGNRSSNGEYIITMLQMFQLRVPDRFQPFTFEVNAYSTITAPMMQTNVTEEVTVEECKVIEGVCPRSVEQNEALDFNFYWPNTNAGNIFAIQCPCRDLYELTEDLFAIRECGTDGSWLKTELSTCVSSKRVVLCEGGDLAGTLFDSLGLPDTLTSGDVAILFSAASTLLTTENINNNTVRNMLLNAFDDLLSTDDDVLLALSETTSIGEKLLSSFDMIGKVRGLSLGETFMVNRTQFALEYVEVSSDDLPDAGYNVKFGGEDGDQVNLPKSVFNGYSDNVRISSSKLKKTSLFRGREESITFASNILSANVLEKEVKDLAEPVTIKFEKITVTPSGMLSSCHFLNTSASRVTGKWSQDGCRLLQETQKEVTCACDHLSSFAVLLTAADSTKPPPIGTISTASIVLPIILGLFPITVTVIVVAVFIHKGEKSKKQYTVGTVDATYSKQLPEKVIENVGRHEESNELEIETSFTESSAAMEHVQIHL